MDRYVVFGGGIDEPDPRDYEYEEVFGTVKDLPRSIDLSGNVVIQNQGTNRKPSTRYACGSYGIVYLPPNFAPLA